jgi:hypothetical protein
LKKYLFLFALAFCGTFPMSAQTHLIWDSLFAIENAEDVKIVKPVYASSGFEITEQLDQYLDSLASRDLKSTRIAGFRILLYSGNERDEATKAREQAYRVFQKADLYTKYQAPTFKVSLGDFYERLDAYIALKKLEAAFPQAVVVQEIVNLKP